MSTPGHAGDGDRAQAYLLTTGAGGVSHHAPREALKNESYCVRAYKLEGRRAPWLLVRLYGFLFTLNFGTSVKETEPGGSTGGVSVDGEGIGVFARTPASHTHLYARTYV